MKTPPIWNIPVGISGGLWDYLHDPELARDYESSIQDSPLINFDVDFVRRFFPESGRLVDLGCGTGRLLRVLARQGAWTLGVDLSEEMLRIVGEKARGEGLTIHRLKANLVELECLADQSFDQAACLFSTLGMVAGAANRQRVVQHVFRLLRPGGTFVLHVHNRGFNVWTRPGRRWLAKDLARSLWASEQRGDYVMPPHQGLAGLTLHLFTRREVVRLLRSVGFRIREVKAFGLRPDGRLPCPWWFSGLRAHGYLIAAQRPLLPLAA
jgi:SAM-dependent methyltransferase